MASLIVNTITSFPELRLSYNGRVYSYHSKEFNSHSKNLVPLFDKCLSESGASLSEIEDVVVIVGPGSYTGIRVGISFVLGISLSLNTNIIPLNLFDVLDLAIDDNRTKQGVIFVDSNKSQEWYYYKKNVSTKDIEIGVVSNYKFKHFDRSDTSLFYYDASNVNSFEGVSFRKVDFSYKLIFDNIEKLGKGKQALEPLYIKKNVYSLK